MTDAMARARTFAHRAVVAATVAGLLEARRGLRVVVAGADASADADADASLQGAADAGAANAGAALLVMTDEGSVADGDVAAVMRRARACVGDAGLVALVVGSLVTRELVATAREAGESTLATGEGGDAYARALEWAREHIATELAPPVAPERLAHIVEAAAGEGLTLVEAESGTHAPALARVRRMKSPRARALLATIALGSGARPMLFVPTGRAPKGGLARLKVDRLADGWVEAGRPSPRDIGRPAPNGDLVRAALAVLDEAAGARRGPLPFKDLLREARERQSADARARGVRATAGSSDTADLAAFLHQCAAHEAVTLYVLEPRDPGWTLTAAPVGLSL